MTAGPVGEHAELLRNDAGSDELFEETVVYVVVGARVYATCNEEHTVLGEHDVVEFFLQVLGLACVDGLALLRDRVLVELYKPEFGIRKEA